MNLVIDEGNTRCKCAWFEKDEILKIENLNSTNVFNEKYLSNERISQLIISSVKQQKSDFDHRFSSLKSSVFFLTHQSHLPIQMAYKTPHTLGNDRIAAAAGAHFLYPKRNLLIIDIGTCITMDFLSEEGVYFGGAISPGVQMRFKALHHFTANLPLVEEIPNTVPLTGDSTQNSIISGVMNGIQSEIEGTIQRYEAKYERLAVITSGGDASLFELNAKSNIFAQPNLVLQGLNKILSYNASLD